MEEMNLVSIGKLGEPKKEFRDIKPWNAPPNQGHRNDYRARGQNNRGFDSQRQGNNSQPFQNQHSEQNCLDNQPPKKAGGRGSRNEYNGRKDYQPSERNEMNQSQGGRGNRTQRNKPTSNWQSEKFENSGWNANSN